MPAMPEPRTMATSAAAPLSCRNASAACSSSAELTAILEAITKSVTSAWRLASGRKAAAAPFRISRSMSARRKPSSVWARQYSPER
jgi:hypothetical protein